MEHHGDAARRQIRLLGSLRVDDAAGPRDVPGQKLQSRLTYLALHSAAPVGRELLAELLAPDEAPERSRRLLSDSLYRLPTLLVAGRADTHTARYAEAEQRLSLALALAQQLGDHAYEVEAMIWLGTLESEQSKWSEARTWALRGLEGARAIGTRSLEGRALRMIGIVTLIAGRTELVALKDALGGRLGATHARHNLGLAYYALGERERARAILERVLHDADVMQTRRLAGLARHDLGALLLKLDQPAEALPHLEAARAAWIEQENLLLSVKSEAFLGLCYLSIGERGRAEALAAEGLQIFQQGVPLGEQPQGWLWALYRLRLALDHLDDAHAVLPSAYAELQRQARAIGDDELRRSFFERVPLNRAIVAHDALTTAARRISVVLARRDAPLGRTLRPDERITVLWTLDAPEDAAIADKAGRRQHRLRRLLQEAEAQGGAPTDDVAQALGVSRRTILRDIDALAHTQQVRATRKRKGAGAL